MQIPAYTPICYFQMSDYLGNANTQTIMLFELFHYMTCEVILFLSQPLPSPHSLTE